MSVKLPASSAAQRKACPGSWRLENQFPGSDSEAAKIGSAAHEVVAKLLTTGELANVDDTSTDGEFITQEMIEGALMVQEYVTDKKIFPCYVEDAVTAPIIHPLSVGVIDVWGWKKQDGQEIIDIVDYKFGHGFVDVFENSQLITYAAGVVNSRAEWKEHGVPEFKADAIFNLTIIQPRCYSADPIRTWSVSLKELQQLYFPELKASEEAATKPDAVCIPSPACEYCAARHACVALQNSSLRAIDSVYTNNKTALLDGVGLSNELRLLQRAKKLIEARLDGIETEALMKLQSGTAIPHYTVEYSRPREQWNVDVSNVEALGELYGLKLLKDPQPITPPQAVKLGLPQEVKDAFSKRARGEPKLAYVNEKQIRKLFSKT